MKREMPTGFSWDETTCKTGVGERIILKWVLKS